MVSDTELDCGFGIAVRVRRADRAFLRDRDHVWETGCVAVDCGGGGENNVGDIMAGHGAEQTDGAVYINAVVLQWNLTGFADGLGERETVSAMDCTGCSTRTDSPSRRQSE